MYKPLIPFPANKDKQMLLLKSGELKPSCVPLGIQLSLYVKV